MKEINQNIIEQIQAIRENPNNKVVIIPHINPDGDAIGSAMALYYFFSESNECNIISPNDIPDFLHWLPQIEQITNCEKKFTKAQKLIQEAHLIIIADHNATDRSGKCEEAIQKSAATKLMIDHHPEPQYPVDLSISSIQVSSTAELTFGFIHSIAPKAINRNIASALYLGIMTDTGNFMHNIHPNTFAIVNNLMSYNIDRDEIYTQVFNNFSAERMQLMGYALYKKMEILPNLHTAIISLEQDELQKFNYQKGDTEGFVNLPLSIKDVKISILIMNKEGSIKLSFRSKGDIAINQIAQKYFNGGGHKNAAGAESSLSMEETIKKLKTALSENINTLIQ